MPALRTTSEPRLVFRPGEGANGDVLILLLLRGGADGIFLVPPHADREYYRQRARLGVAPPGEPGGALDLDGFYGLHPQLAPLLESYRSGQLAVVHACGSPDQSLSHFEASKTLERGVTDGKTISTGWISRHLTTREAANHSPLQAIAFSNILPDVLAGTPVQTITRSLAELRLRAPAACRSSYQALLAGLYDEGADAVTRAGRQSLELLRDLGKFRFDDYRPEQGVVYPGQKLGRALMQIAQLVKADMGLESAVLELGGWDSHVRQVEQLTRPLDTLAQALSAFVRDVGKRMQQVVVLVMSEFGRRVRENSAAGTDHGRGTALFVLGGGVRGGKVYGRWPGLAPGQTDGAGNLAVTTDYRDVLAEVVTQRLKNPHVHKVFPHFTPRPLGLVTQRI